MMEHMAWAFGIRSKGSLCVRGGVEIKRRKFKRFPVGFVTTSYHFPLGLVGLSVLQLVLQDDPPFLNICIGWRLPSHLDIRVDPGQADVQ